jgi:hypothetical protein
MKPYYYCIIIILSAFCSCRSGTDAAVKNVLDDLVKRYPELYGNGLIDKYKSVRKLYDDVDSLEMRLLERDHGEQQIIILSNDKGQAYSVPFPDNDNRGYWEFYGETTEKTSTDKTFDAEMNKAFETLSINDDFKAGKVFNEMMVSLVQSGAVFPADSSTISNSSEMYLRSDSCSAISKRNFQAMFSNLEATAGSYLSTFMDFDHYRFYQFKQIKMRLKKKCCKIIVYRKPCVIKPITL